MTYAVKVSVRMGESKPFVCYIGLYERFVIPLEKVRGCKKIKTAERWMANRIDYDKKHPSDGFVKEYKIITL